MPSNPLGQPKTPRTPPRHPQASGSRRQRNTNGGDIDDADLDGRGDVGNGRPDIDYGDIDDGDDVDDLIDPTDYFDDPRDTYTGDQGYNQSVSKADLARTKYIRPLVDFTKNSDLMPDTKDTMVTIIHGLFDKTEVLAKTENLRLAILDADLVLTQAKVGFHPSDVDNPILTTLYNMIKHHYARYISRSEKGWERGLQNLMETSMTQRIVDNRNEGFSSVGSNPKKPWYRRWF